MALHFALPIAALIYVLTGGPAVGKTSILKELAEQGEHTIREAATDIIAHNNALGIRECWNADDFNYTILQLILERESSYLSKEGRVFIERGIFDPFTYHSLFSSQNSSELAKMQAISGDMDVNDRYAAIFLILPYNGSDFIPIQDEIRHDDKEFDAIQDALYSTYSKHKHFIVVPGGLTPKERAAFILNRIHKIENHHTSS